MRTVSLSQSRARFVLQATWSSDEEIIRAQNRSSESMDLLGGQRKEYIYVPVPSWDCQNCFTPVQLSSTTGELSPEEDIQGLS